MNNNKAPFMQVDTNRPEVDSELGSKNPKIKNTDVLSKPVDIESIMQKFEQKK